MRHALSIAWIAVRELLYEKVFYLLVLFAIAALTVSLMLGQMTYTEQTKLTLDFMLAGIQLSMILFSVFVGISLFQRELQLGSVAMVLSKPISRTSFLLGKYLGQIAVQWGVTTIMAVITLISCPGLPYSFFISIAQACWLIFLEGIVITSVAYLFAVNFGALVAGMATLSFFIAGHFTAVPNARATASEEVSWAMIKAFVPKLEAFNMKSLASYGFTIPWSEVGIATIYALVMTVMFLTFAALTFNRRDILT